MKKVRRLSTAAVLLVCILIQEAVCELFTFGVVSAGIALAGYMFKDTFTDNINAVKKITDSSICSTVFGKYYECCGPPWVKADIRSLKLDLKRNVFGQHIVDTIIPAALAASTDTFQPTKPLVMSFHGWPGGGKNYVANFIAKNYFRNGVHSYFYHYINSRIHFPLESKVASYQEQLRNWVYFNVSQCPHSMFVFDEIDKMPAKILDGIKPYLDHHESLDGVDFRRAVFIFLSNTGGSLITERYIDIWRKEGKTREQMTLEDFENVIGKGAFNQKGGFYMSDVIDHNLVDHFIPFLPLEKEHVIQCIKAELNKYYGTGTDRQNIINEVLKSVTFGPKPEALFSSNGCKRLSQKIAAIFQRDKMRKISYEI